MALTGARLIAQPIIEWLTEYNKSQLWLVVLLSCHTRKVVPIMAKTKADLGHHIRTHVRDFLIFFQHLARKCTEFDRLAIKLRDRVTELYNEDDAIIDNEELFLPIVTWTLSGFSDEEIIDEFYGFELDGENTFKVCIDGPLLPLTVT